MKETIVAQATAPGRGGIGILRVSGPLATEVAQAVLGKCPKPRMADYLPFKDADGTVLDQGIALYFKSPNSFTFFENSPCKDFNAERAACSDVASIKSAMASA